MQSLGYLVRSEVKMSASEIQMAEENVQDLPEILIEQDEDETSLDIPPDRRRVRTEKSDLPVDTIFNWVSRGKINPQPEFQRDYVWNDRYCNRARGGRD